MSNTMPRRRVSAMLAVLLLSLVGITVRLSYVQGVRADEFSAKARAQRLREIPLPARRGAIYDRNGRELAISVPARTIYANPKQIHDPVKASRAIAPLLQVDEKTLEKNLGDKSRGFVYLARAIDVAVAKKVLDLKIVGVNSLEESRRTYPGGALASNVLGFVGVDGKGLSGLEFTYDKLLGGRPGHRTIEQDPQGRRIPQGVFVEKAPIPGSDLVLGIDRDIQFAAEQALNKQVEANDAKGGSVVVLDPATGELLAIANSPTFDPVDRSNLKPGEMRNRAVTDVYEPGSVSKVVTASAALEEGVVTKDTKYLVPATMRLGGRVFSDSHGHPTETMTFADIIAESSNVGTIKVAQQLGAERLTKYMRKFGYGKATGLGFPGEGAGVVPSASRWGTSLPTMAIGQGVSATAVQLSRVFGTVANDGVSMEPTLVSGWVDPDGGLHQSSESRAERVVSSTTASTMREILTKVTTDGTGTKAQIAGYQVAGKTGTAQKVRPGGGYAGYMSSFYGFLPSNAPRVVIGVVLDDPASYYGGVVAAPVFREVAMTAIRVMRISPTAIDQLQPPSAVTEVPKAQAIAPKRDAGGPPVPGSVLR